MKMPKPHIWRAAGLGHWLARVDLDSQHSYVGHGPTPLAAYEALVACLAARR